MRGIRAYMWFVIAASRFIPADAGNTASLSCLSQVITVHPRGCGEYDYIRSVSCDRYGSSPRMRGIQHNTAAVLVRYRFIPADAGNTSADMISLASGSVHPRGCGEY